MSAQLIKELRERTGAGMMDCKKAIEATGNVEKAIEWLQERGAAKAAKKAGAIAADGVVITHVEGGNAVIFELNSQTDFVAQNKEFMELTDKIAKALVHADFTTSEEANEVKIDGKTLAEVCVDATAKIGEKIVLRRAVKIAKSDLVIGAYTHVNKRVAAIVVTKGGNEEAARNVAMHVASMNPKFLDEAAVPAHIVAEMKEEIMASPALTSKPEAIRPKIAEGMLRKQLSELTLVDQEFVMDKMPVSTYLKNFGGVAVAMFRFEVGEGIEKASSNFAEEVAAQMAAAK